jgi:hypothetical protein
MNLKKKIAQTGAAARYLVDTPPGRKTYFAPVLFLALLIPAIAGQLAAAEEPASGNYVLVIDVYSGAVPPDVTQEKGCWLWLEALKKTEEPGRLPKVIHIERVLSENDFDIAGQGDANG